VASTLAAWATGFQPSDEDLALARRALLDTLAVMHGAREHPLSGLFTRLSEAGRWAALAHVLDYDDLHMPSTTHISAVCVAAALAGGGGADAYLAGAGVMARLGTALGWRHYEAGWHATCTAGAPAAAVAAAVGRGLGAERTGVAMALAIPAAGGVQRAFGTAAKSLQVAFAVEAGIRAADLAEAGATADVCAVEDWMALVGGDPAAVDVHGPAVPGGLAVKLYPCCYALQRPISAALALGPLPLNRVRAIRVATPACSLAPLIHHRPRTGLEGKFSLEYGIAAALIDRPPGLASFSDEAVRRPEAVRIAQSVETVVSADRADQSLLAGEVEIEVVLDDGRRRNATLVLPPGAPDRPPTDAELRSKLELCAGAEADVLAALSWESAATYLRARLAA
jgi:2-methylcitrate dehydratase PrpD